MDVAATWAARSRRKRLGLLYREFRLRLHRASAVEKVLGIVTVVLFVAAFWRQSSGSGSDLATRDGNPPNVEPGIDWGGPVEVQSKPKTAKEEDDDFSEALANRAEGRQKLIGYREAPPVPAPPKPLHGRRYPPALDVAASKVNKKVRTVPEAGVRWLKMAPDIALVVKTGKEVAKDRLAQMKSAWFDERDFPNLLIVSDEADEELGIMSLPELEKQMYTGLSAGRYDLDNTTGIPKNVLQGGWRGDKDKNLPAFLALYSKFPNARFYIMIDDDTYLFLDNIAEALEGIWDQAFATPQWGGNLFRISCAPWQRSGATMGLKNPVFAHGGSGIVVNHKALEYLIPFIPDCIKKYAGCWAGDMMFAACLLEHGVPCNLRFRHFTGEPPHEAAYGDKLGTLWHSNKRVGTLHKMNKTEYESVAAWHAKVGPYKAIFSSLREHLEENHILTPPVKDNQHSKHQDHVVDDDPNIAAAPVAA